MARIPVVIPDISLIGHSRYFSDSLSRTHCSNCAFRIARPSAAAKGGGTALPICRITYKEYREREVKSTLLKTSHEHEEPTSRVSLSFE